MDEFGETLNRVLSDPAEMEKIRALAAQLMGETPAAEPEPEAAAPEQESPPEMEPGALFRALRGQEKDGSDGKAALVRAMSPYLRPERRERLRKSLRLVQAARVAGVAMKAFGGEGRGL